MAFGLFLSYHLKARGKIPVDKPIQTVFEELIVGPSDFSVEFLVMIPDDIRGILQPAVMRLTHNPHGASRLQVLLDLLKLVLRNLPFGIAFFQYVERGFPLQFPIIL